MGLLRPPPVQTTRPSRRYQTQQLESTCHLSILQCCIEQPLAVRYQGTYSYTDPHLCISGSFSQTDTDTQTYTKTHTHTNAYIFLSMALSHKYTQARALTHTQTGWLSDEISFCHLARCATRCISPANASAAAQALSLSAVPLKAAFTAAELHPEGDGGEHGCHIINDYRPPLSLSLSLSLSLALSLSHSLTLTHIHAHTHTKPLSAPHMV